MTDPPPCYCLPCSTTLGPDGVAVVRADTVVRLLDHIANGLHKIECTNCSWRTLSEEAMALDVLATALESTHNTEGVPS